MALGKLSTPLAFRFVKSGFLTNGCSDLSAERYDALP